jgi:hypothetical protein
LPASRSSSFSAAASTGTASGEPQFPSATATFLSSPRRFARFTGDFRNRRENSAWSFPINPIGFAPCTPSRGQNASSAVICTNLGAFHGHSSWSSAGSPIS